MGCEESLEKEKEREREREKERGGGGEFGGQFVGRNRCALVLLLLAL